jgi:RNA recognition motif. (a.k.a. RRM, RBD, or RNP domain)
LTMTSTPFNSTQNKSYEEIMGIRDTKSSNAATDATTSAIQALSNRLTTFRKWLADEAKVTIHPAVCIVNGEATDGTKNAPVMVVQKPTNFGGYSNNSSTISGSVGESSSMIVDNTALHGRIGTVDGDGEISLYDRTMGCCIRAVRELKANEVFMTMPRSAMITPDLVAASDAGRAILACCKINKSAIDHNTLGGSTGNILGYWDAFENTTICQSKFTAKISRLNGPQVLIKILQERKNAEIAWKKSIKTNHATIHDNKNHFIERNNGMSHDEEKNYKLAEYGTISTRAPILAFLIHQRFYHSMRPPVVSSDGTYNDDDDDGDDTYENEFQAARDSDDGNALSAIDTHGGTMPVLPPDAPETFAPYTRTLPSSVSIPLCWKRNELALLANCIPGAPLLHEVGATTYQLVAEFTALLEAGITSRFPKTFPEGLLTWDRWVWAAAVFSSRILPATCYLNEGDQEASNFRPSNKHEFQSPSHIWDELGVMIPLLDMLNHEIDEHQVTWQPCDPPTDEPDADGMRNNAAEFNESNSPHPPRAIVHKKVRKGCEVYCCYGNLTTSNLILQYGFAQINGNLDKARLGWSLSDAVGNIDPPHDLPTICPVVKNCIFDSTDEIAIKSWWTDDRIKLLKQEAFSRVDESYMQSVRAGSKTMVTAHSDGTFHPILLAAAVVATTQEKKLQEFQVEDDIYRHIVISKQHQKILQCYLQYSFTRKLEKLLQNLDNGLKDHFGKLNLWTKASNGGLRYDREQNDNNGNYVGWQTFFDSHVYKATMEVEKKYYAMGSDSCVLAFLDGQLRALQVSLDHLSDDDKFATVVIQQLKDLGFMFSDDDEAENDQEDFENDDTKNKKLKYEPEEPWWENEPNVSPESHEKNVESIDDAAEPVVSETKAKENGKAANGSKSPRNRRRNRKKSLNAEKPPAIKLHIGNLSYTTTPAHLYNYFSSIYGQDNVLECHIPSERETGKSRGFGFVAMPEIVAKRALQSKHKHEVDGRILKIARSNSVNSVNSSKPADGPTPSTSGRCATCGYSPKYCTCLAPNLPMVDRYPLGIHGPPPIPPPVPPPIPHHPLPIGRRFEHPEYGREPPRDFGGYFAGPPPDRYLDVRPRAYYDAEDRLRDYERDFRSFDYRYDDNYFRGSYDRDDEKLRENRRSGRDRGRIRDGSPASRSSGNNEEAGLSSRNKDESRAAKRMKKEDSDEWEHKKKRSLDRKERNKKKKSKRRTRSRSRSTSPT